MPGTLTRGEVGVAGGSSPLVTAGPTGDAEAVVFVHGNPGGGEDWAPMVARVGTFARAVAWDHPGFGRGPRGRRLDHTVDGYARYLGEGLDDLGIERAHLVLHDFGGPWGLRYAAEHPERIGSVVLANTGAMLDYTWHSLARLWRTPVAGELFFLLMRRRPLAKALSKAEPRPLPDEMLDRVWAGWDGGFRRAVLRLYRSVDDPGALGADLATALAPHDLPALVVWGDQDIYLPRELAERQREAFPRVEVHSLPDSGHWPFLDDPDGFAAAVEPFLRARLGRGVTA